MRRRSVLVLALGFLIGMPSAVAMAQPQTATVPAAATPAACPVTTKEENIALARRWHEVVINQRDLDDLDNILSRQLVHHAAGGYPDARTVAEVKDDLDDFLAGFPDIHITINLIVADGAYVVEDYTATGTQDGPFQGRPPSGTPVTWTGINIFRIECGKIGEIWSEVDALSRNQQLSGTPIATPAP